MALEDFASEKDEQRADLRSVQRPIDFSDPENEDLFDFEDTTVFPAGMTPAPAPARAPAPAADPAPAQPPVSAEAPAEVVGGARSVTADEDLFDSVEPAATLASAPREPEPPQPGASAPTAPTAPEPTVGAAPGPSPQTVGGGTPALAPSAPAPAAAAASRVTFTEDELPALVMPARAELPPLGARLPAALIGAFVLLNLLLAFFAWRASRSFEATLGAVTDTLAEALDEARLRGPLGPVAGFPQVPEPAPGEQRPFELEPDEVPSAIENFHELSVRVARQHMEQGQYAEARMGLYHMLANEARGDVPPSLAAEAEFMIAETYERQALSMAREEVP